MDWCKVKRILIIALILTNVVIAYFLLQKTENVVSYTEEERLAMIEKILAQRGINNNISEKPIILTMPKVKLEYQDYDLKAIAMEIFKGSYREIGGDYIGSDYTISLVDNGSVFYLRAKDASLNPPPIPIESAKSIASDFLKRLNFSDDYFYIGSEKQNNLLKLHYIQTYGEYFIDNTYMSITVADGVVAIERRWTNVSEIEGETLNIISYGEALFKALDLIEKNNYPRPLQINALKLGYGLKNSAFGEVILAGEALPYYRFFISEGEDIVVPALKVQ